MVHFLAVVKEPVPHAVQRAGMQHPVVQPGPQAEVGQRGEQVDVRGGHLVDQPVSGHGVEPAMVDGGAVRFVILDVAHQVEGGAVEELGPEGMGHRAGHPAARAHLAEHIRMVQPEHVAVAGTAMLCRGDAGVDRGITTGRDRGQHRADLPHLGIAAVDPTLEVAEQPPPVAPRHPVENDEKEFPVHGVPPADA